MIGKWKGKRRENLPRKCWNRIGEDRVGPWRRQTWFSALGFCDAPLLSASPTVESSPRLGRCPRTHLPYPTSSSFFALQRATQLCGLMLCYASRSPLTTAMAFHFTFRPIILPKAPHQPKLLLIFIQSYSKIYSN